MNARALRSRWGPRIAACAAITLFAAAAHAAPPISVALDYEVAPDTSGCPDAEEFRTAVARQLGYDPFRPTADRRVGVQIAPKDSGFDGRIRWTDARGRSVGDRHLTSRRSECREIGASLAFSVAVQIQLLASLTPAAPEPAPAPPAPAPPPPPTPPQPPEVSVTVAPPPDDDTVAPPAPPPAPSPQTRRLRLSAGAGPALALGVAPEPTGLARLFVSGRVAAFSLELGVDAALRSSQYGADGSGFSLDRLAAGAAACGHAGAFAACLTGTGGRLAVRGVGVDAPASPIGWFSQVGARIAATGELGDRYFATARVDGLVMLSSWTVTLNDAAAWTTPRMSMLVGVDIGARFF